MEKPKCEESVEKYIDELCRYAVAIKGKDGAIRSSNISVILDIFSPPGKAGKLVAVGEETICNTVEYNMGVWRHIFERKIKILEMEKRLLQERVDELESLFGRELEKIEEEKIAEELRREYEDNT